MHYLPKTSNTKVQACIEECIQSSNKLNLFSAYSYHNFKTHILDDLCSHVCTVPNPSRWFDRHPVYKMLSYKSPVIWKVSKDTEQTIRAVWWLRTIRQYIVNNNHRSYISTVHKRAYFVPLDGSEIGCGITLTHVVIGSTCCILIGEWGGQQVYFLTTELKEKNCKMYSTFRKLKLFWID